MTIDLNFVQFILEILTFGSSVAVLIWRLSSATARFEIIGRQQAEEIKEIKVSVEKMESVVSQIAVQQARLDSLQAQLVSMDQRYERRFERQEELIDEIRQGRRDPNPIR